MPIPDDAEARIAPAYKQTSEQWRLYLLGGEVVSDGALVPGGEDEALAAHVEGVDEVEGSFNFGLKDTPCFLLENDDAVRVLFAYVLELFR